MESEPNRSIVPPADARNQRRRFPDDSEEEQQWENPGKRMKRGKYTPKAWYVLQFTFVMTDID